MCCVHYRDTSGRWASMVSVARVNGVSVDVVSALGVGLILCENLV